MPTHPEAVITSPWHTISVALVLNRELERHDGRVVYAHLYLVLDRLKRLLDFDLERLERALREEGTLELDAGTGRFLMEVEGDRVRVRECPYRDACRRLIPRLGPERPLILPCTVLVQLALDRVKDRTYVSRLEPGEEECTVHLSHAPS
ncbi:hypothetical protein, partial [Methanopyrus sp.]